MIPMSLNNSLSLCRSKDVRHALLKSIDTQRLCSKMVNKGTFKAGTVHRFQRGELMGRNRGLLNVLHRHRGKEGK